MNTTAEKTVRELAVELPHAARVFEKWGIDYCCGGGRSLTEACEAAHVKVDQVLRALDGEPCAPAGSSPEHDWMTEPLSNLIEHIVNTHHKYTREELDRLTALLDKVCSVHATRHPELLRVQTHFIELKQELTLHMMKEEKVLFPYLERMEESVLQKEPVVPPPFGTVQNPVHMMMQEHDSAGATLRVMREASDEYQAPADGCFSYRTLYQALAAFEVDLHQHIHLENNILFPRAVEMEGQH